MGGKNVKSTILQWGLGMVAPHLCSGCLKIGGPLCTNCKYDITSEPFVGCMLCGIPSREGICSKHNQNLLRTWIVSERSPVLKELINKYKFENSKSYALSLASLLDVALPLLPPNTVLVPVPTVRARVRQRGYDHIDLLARHVSNLRNLPLQRLLTRRGVSVQHMLNRQQRTEAAKDAYVLAEGARVDTSKIYVLIDDVVTTGATISSAAKVLAKAGATVWAVALAYQPLD